MAETGLICAWLLDGAGGGRALDWEGVRAWTPEEGPLWVHLDYAKDDSQAWLADDANLPPVIRQALLADDPRPRAMPVGNDLMMIIRGVNLNQGAQPEDMVSLRVWVEEHRTITLRHRRFNAIKAMNDDTRDGHGPGSTSDLLADLVERILHRIARVVNTIDDEVDELEGQVLDADSLQLRHQLARFRRQAITLRRFIAPQREVLGRLQSARLPWLADEDRDRLRESSDRLLRSIEELDAAKERAMVTQEELANRISEAMNRRLYALSIVASVFLPLGFITGMLGVNLGGIPGTSFHYGFAILCAGMVVLGGVQIWLFRKLGWF